jgi:hypothetical protein
MFPLRVLTWRWEREGIVNGKRGFDIAEAPGHPFCRRMNIIDG